MPYSPYIYRYSASETTPLRKIEREIIYEIASRKSYLVIICPISHEKLTKCHYVSLFGFIYSYFAPIYHFGPDLALFIYIFQYLALLNYIYPHLVIFILNCRNLTIYAIFTLHLHGGEGRRLCCGQMTWFCSVVGRQRLCLGQATALLCDYIRFSLCLN